MTSRPTGGLLAVHAHPDDETLATGGLLAAWAADGRPVTLVTCTRGERGEVIPAALAALEGDGPALAAHRAGELAAAVECLGVGDHLFLDTVPARPIGPDARFEDSGMAWLGTGRAGAPGRVPAGAFVACPVDDAAARLARVIRARRPDVVVTYEPGGGYGHPDHVHAHDVTMRAVELAAAPGAGDPAEPTHTVAVVLWAAVPDDVLRAAYAALAHLPAAHRARAGRAELTLPDPSGALPTVAVPPVAVDVRVDTAPVLDRVVAALRAHATQVGSVVLGEPVPLAHGVVLAGCYALSNDVLAPLLTAEAYRYAPAPAPTSNPAPTSASTPSRAAVAWPAGVRPVA